MKILVANLGSTSFKYRLYDLGDGAETLLARGSVERIGSPTVEGQNPIGPRRGRNWSSRSPTTATPSRSASNSSPTRSSACSKDAGDVSAIGFKAVHARNITGVQRVDEDVSTGDGGVRRRRAGP